MLRDSLSYLCCFISAILLQLPNFLSVLFPPPPSVFVLANTACGSFARLFVSPFARRPFPSLPCVALSVPGGLNSIFSCRPRWCSPSRCSRMSSWCWSSHPTLLWLTWRPTLSQVWRRPPSSPSPPTASSLSTSGTAWQVGDLCPCAQILVRIHVEKVLLTERVVWFYEILCQINLEGIFSHERAQNHFHICSFISFLHVQCLIHSSRELTRLVSIGWTLIWETVDCVCWIAGSNVTHAAASVRSHVHLHTSASLFTKPYLLSSHPAPGRNIKFDISGFMRMKTDWLSVEPQPCAPQTTLINLIGLVSWYNKQVVH